MRSTIHKQNSFITRYWLAAVVLLALLGPLGGESRGDFILWSDQWLTVDSYHSVGTLYDMSRAFIVSGGSVGSLYAYGLSNAAISAGSVAYLYANNSSRVAISGGSVTYLAANNSSTVDISGGSVNNLDALYSSTVNISGGSVNILYNKNSSAVDISGGSVNALYANDSSAVDISGGSVANLAANNSSTVAVSGGSVTTLTAADWSTVDISGGSVTNLLAKNSSTVDISGGSVPFLHASSSSVVTFYGRNFRVYGGLVFDGDYVLGTGLLAGEWFDGTPWAVNITEHTPSATILVIPDSGPKPLCVKYPAMDFNGDCKVDFGDLAVFLTHWLDCNLEPASACWE